MPSVDLVRPAGSGPRALAARAPRRLPCPATRSPPRLPPPPTAPLLSRDRAATARARAGHDQGVLGGPPPANPLTSRPPLRRRRRPQQTPSPAPEALYSTGDFASAGDAFGDFIARYPSNPRAAEAITGSARASTPKAWRDAIPSYAAALKDQPKTAWAGRRDPLADRSSQSSHPAQACAAWPNTAASTPPRHPPVKADAAAVRTRAKCG